MIRLPNLHAMRFFAALAVIVFHIEFKKNIFGLPTVWHKSYFISNVGYHAVTFFFVLSGFLITYLMLNEIDKSGKLDFKKFYIRRVLRIFPVFYVTIFIGFFVLPYFPITNIPVQTENLINHYWPSFIQSSIFLSNLSFALYENMAAIDQTWSVSTEEQFYLIWPFIIAGISRKTLPIFLVFVVLVGMIARQVFYSVPVIETLLYMNRFGCMAIGALLALAIHEKYKILRYLGKPYILFFSLVIAVLILGVGLRHMKYIEPELISICFAIIIYGLTFGAFKNFPLNGSIFNTLGNYSYSAYMYHNIFIAISCNIAMEYGLISNWFIYGFVLSMTFFASFISWKFMEKPALNLKDKFYASTSLN